jgi:hypothetical protein
MASAAVLTRKRSNIGVFTFPVNLTLVPGEDDDDDRGDRDRRPYGA